MNIRFSGTMWFSLIFIQLVLLTPSVGLWYGWIVWDRETKQEQRERRGLFFLAVAVTVLWFVATGLRFFVEFTEGGEW